MHRELDIFTIFSSFIIFKRFIFLVFIFIVMPVYGQDPMVNFFIVDTVKIDSNLVYRNYDSGFYFISNNHTHQYHLLSIDFLNKLEDVDYNSFHKVFGIQDFNYEFPVDAGTHKKMQKVKFRKSPRFFIRLLIKGKFYNKVTVWIDDPIGPYPFKDENAFYLIFVPVWN